MNLSFTVWDDIIDSAPYKMFKPTLFGKYGQGLTIIAGGIASARAFTIINESKIENPKRLKISRSIWKLWTKMASEEAITVKTRKEGTASSSKKFSKIKSEAINLGTCLKVGAIIGNGSINEINHLDRYGRYLSIMLSLREDFQVSLNLTVELAEKIRSNRLPYSILWTTEHSTQLNMELKALSEKEIIDNDSMKRFIKHVLDTQIISYISEKLIKYAKKANAELNYLPPSAAQQSLKVFVEVQSSLPLTTANRA